MRNRLLKRKFSILIPIFMLIALSLLDMYGAKYMSDLYESAFARQSIWVIVGVLVMAMIYKIDMKFFLKYSGYFYLIGIISLILVLFFGRNINGANSWFKLGPVSFQPSELFKFFYIIFLASVVNKERKGGFKLLFMILFLSFVPSLLIFLEPDTGVVIMYALMMFGILLESKVDKKYIALLVVTGGIFLGGFVGLYFLNGELFTELFGTSFFYRMDRLLSFTNSSSYQLSNAVIGIGAGGLTGMGITSEKIYIPEATTDFVFDLTICNFGFLIGVIVILIYVYLLIRLHIELERSKRCADRVIISGIFFMMLFQVFEHILMNIGLTPITGITLPFLSYGGSSLLSYFMLFGLVLKITTNNSSYN